MQMRGFDCCTDVQLLIYQYAKCRIVSQLYSRLTSYYILNIIRSGLRGSVGKHVSGELTVAVRSAADSCQSNSTASSSTLPHWHCKISRKRKEAPNKWSGNISDYFNASFTLVPPLTLKGKCRFPVKSCNILLLIIKTKTPQAQLIITWN